MINLLFYQDVRFACRVLILALGQTPCSADRAACGSPTRGGMSRSLTCPFWSSFECGPH